MERVLPPESGIRSLVLLHAALGLALVAATVVVFFGPLGASKFLPAFPLQLLVGVTTVLLIAWLGAPRLNQGRRAPVLSAIALSISSFVAGCLAASFLNLFLLGDLLARGDWFSYVLTPLYWLFLIGLPLCLLLGVLLGLSLRARRNRPAV